MPHRFTNSLTDLAAIEEHWRQMWDMNTNGPQAPHASLADCLKIFAGEEARFFGVRDSALLLELTRAVVESVCNTKTHTRKEILNAFKPAKKTNRRRRIFFAATCAWFMLVAACTLLMRSRGSYFSDDDLSRMLLWMFIPPAVGAACYRLYLWAFK
jgi:hypothetical protein